MVSRWLLGGGYALALVRLDLRHQRDSVGLNWLPLPFSSAVCLPSHVSGLRANVQVQTQDIDNLVFKDSHSLT